MADPVLSIDQLYKAYSSLIAVNKISFEVNRGEIFGLLGPNGAGKTTTIRMVMDIIAPDSGTALVLGQKPGAMRHRVGYLPEERGLYRSLKVRETLVYLGQLKGMSKKDAEKKSDEWLARVDLKDWAKNKIQELSRGMQQKVQLISSVLHDPDLIILDEPFQGLDPVNVEAVRSIIRGLRDAGKTVVLSAHEMSQVEVLCERIALINRGQIVLYGNLSEIKKQFAPNAIEIAPPLNLEGWGEVARAEMVDGRQKVYLTASASPRELLKKIFERGMTVDRFEMATASLDEIFIKVVKEPPEGSKPSGG
jgi:ABC-2 type transport system ATP-binding protein